MKKNFLLLAALLTLFSACVPMKYNTATLPVQEQVFDDIVGTKSELYVKSNEWMVQMFNNRESVVQFSDKEEGALIGKYLMFGEFRSLGMYNITTDTRVFAKIDIRVKDNKAKISVAPVGSWKHDPSGRTIYSYGSEQAKKDIDYMIENFHLFLKSNKTAF